MKYDWHLDDAWAKTLYNALKVCLADLRLGEISQYELVPSSDLQDQREGADGWLYMPDLSIAWRFRRGIVCLEKYKDITIRSWRKTGAETEFAKIKSGLGDYFFYGCANTSQDGFAAWVLLDLKKARDGGLFNQEWRQQMNPDGETGFRFIPLREIVPYLVRSHGLQRYLPGRQLDADAKPLASVKV